MKEAALRYAALGYYVAPLWPKEKMPMQNLRSSTPTIDPLQIRQWWELCPTANIGLPTDNRYNALIVLDLDVGPDIVGAHTLRQLCETHGLVLPDTAVARSGSGGYHVYYGNPEKYPVAGGKDLFPGIDVRAEGAHIVVPPSVHNSGVQYAWVHGDVTCIAPANYAIFALLKMASR